MTNLKPYDISKRRLLEAYWRVKANQGAAGIDGESLEMFEADLTGNLYKLWNRLSSGSYFPPPVRQVEIPKKNGGVRILGVPTVADRVAQQVVVTRIGGDLFGVFHPDSHGYQLNKSAVNAVANTRKRCWEFDWVVEFDIRRAFDHASQYPPQEPTYASKVRCLSLPALSLRSAASVAGLSGKRYSLVRASRESAMAPLLMRS